MVIKRGITPKPGKFLAIGRKVEEIRARKVFLGAPAIREMNESHALEFLARSLVVPVAKKVFGKDLKAVILVGSPQIGVRRASLSRGSDLDIEFVVADSARRVNSRFNQLNSAVFDAFTNSLGVSVSRVPRPNLLFSTEKQFALVRPKRSTPFQILHGVENVKRILGENYAMARAKKMPLKEKYTQTWI